MQIASVNLWIVMYDRVVVSRPYYLFHTSQSIETRAQFGGVILLADTGEQGDPLVFVCRSASGLNGPARRRDPSQFERRGSLLYVRDEGTEQHAR